MVRAGEHRDMAEVGIVSVNVAQPAVLLRSPGGDVISAINKKPVDADAVMLTRLNLQGDQQADTRRTRDGGQVHGGSDQAVYAFIGICLAVSPNATKGTDAARRSIRFGQPARLSGAAIRLALRSRPGRSALPRASPKGNPRRPSQ
jgi:hypothetical protein